LYQREFDNAICAARCAAQMAENGKNRLAIFTIFRLRRTDVVLRHLAFSIVKRSWKALSIQQCNEVNAPDFSWSGLYAPKKRFLIFL